MSKQEIRSLEEKLEELGKRVDKLESMLATLTKIDPSGAAKTEEQLTSAEISREVVLAISAAVAAFLGKRASIRQIRLTGETPWAMQGRATVQASHGIEFVRGLR
jgi:methylmalonyl-CoA carboxyltransferase large subunit